MLRLIGTRVESAWLHSSKLEYDEPLPSFAVTFNLRLYGAFASRAAGKSMRAYFLGGGAVARGLGFRG
jgi:hypothetical protein